MKRQKIQFIVLIVVLAALIGGYFGLQKYNEYLANNTDEEPAEMAIDLDVEEIIEISYDYNGETITMIKEEDTWKYKDDTSLNLMQNRINTMAEKLAQMESLGTIADANLEDYGLDEPSRSIRFAAADVSCEIFVGDYNSISSVYYISIDDGTTVYAVDDGTFTSFSYTLDGLIEEEEETAEEDIAE